MRLNNPGAPATSRQLWMLHILTKQDTRNLQLTMQQASDAITKAKQGGNGHSQSKDKQFKAIWAEATAAGEQALADCTPTPMVVQQHKNMLDDASPVQKQWFVEGGACGFAWIVLRPATSSFAKWLKANDLARKHYYGGLSIWASVGGQSMERKMAWAGAVAKVLCDHGFDAYADSRMD